MSTSRTRTHSPRSDGKPCMCSVCVCGKHHCPGILETLPFDGNTHYREYYTPKAGEGRTSFAPRNQYTPTPVAPGHYQTTNETHRFSQADVQRPTSCKPRSELAMPAPFMGATTQRTDYQPYQLQPRCSSAPPRRPLDKTVGTYETTNRAMQGPVIMALREGQAARSRPMLHPDSIVNNRQPFEGLTSYQEYYPPKKSVYERLLRSRAAMSGLPAGDDRDFVTTKAMHYKQPPAAGICPAAKFSKRPASADGHVTCKDCKK